MTDNEIIKALHCCISLNTYGGDCDEGCPYIESKTVEGCFVEMIKDTLSLINRQKTKLESQQELNKQLEIDVFNANMNLDLSIEKIYEYRKAVAEVKLFKKKIQAEAIKEFAERLKNKLTSCSKAIDGKSEYLVCDFDIDSLVKEMVGE